MGKPQQQALVRLNKLISSTGACSRREADYFMEKGWVQVAGWTNDQIRPGVKVPPGTSFTLLPEAQRELRKGVSIILHKPIGIVSSQPEQRSSRAASNRESTGFAYQPAIQLLTPDNRASSCPFRNDANYITNPRHQLKRKLAVAGRLDAQSSGLLLFTQSGSLARHIIGPDSNMEKEYLVRIGATTQRIPPKRSIDELLRGERLVSHFYRKSDEVELIGDEDGRALSLDVQLRIDRMLQGVYSLRPMAGRRGQHGDDTKPQQHQDIDLLQAKSVSVLNKQQLQVTLTQGHFHHLRRLCHAVGWSLVGLKRVRIGSIVLGDLGVGQWRRLTPKQIATLSRKQL